MLNQQSSLTFQQIHIDVARNATDDFNLFHDPDKWMRIKLNPFLGPIALGFQVESLIEHSLRSYRNLNDEQLLIDKYNLQFSNYQFTFANAVKPNQEIKVDIKKSQLKLEPEIILSNRISVKSDKKLALMGYKKESQYPLFLKENDLSYLGDLRHLQDRCFLEQAPKLFLKRKFLNVSNAKNFLCGSLANQNDYFDELTNTVYFPEIFPCSLVSCALLEKALVQEHDFEKNPMVYTSHKISVDKALLHQLKSNDVLHILVEKVTQDGLGDDQVVDYHCYGLLENNKVLFRAIISLCPLAAILNR
ncbi:MAG: hypothetical protein GQ532_15225 [Methylomarinum sp.]|nr:hypothetical protein [Methylomarinum sp.]